MTDNAVRPKLVVAGAAAALEWYAEILDAEILQRHDAGDTVAFAALRILGTTVTLKDADAHDPVSAPGPILDVVVDDPDALARRMVDAGGEVVFPVADQPYGARGGRVRDPYGVQWLVQTPLDLPVAEVQAAIDEMGD